MDNILSKSKEAIKSVPAKLKANWKKVIAVLVLVILIAAITTLGVMKYNDNKTISDKNSKIETQESQITKLSDVLSQTEEGKKQLEQVNSSLEQDKSQLTNDNQALNQKVADANAQLASVQASLNQKNAELASATKCVNLFKSVQSQFDAFNANINKAQSYYEQAYKAQTYEEFDRLMNLGDQAYNAAMANYNSLQASISKFKTGKC